jgi:predicted ThiF/HesA family dinucleotide-utilizing enzyme
MDIFNKLTVEMELRGAPKGEISLRRRQRVGLPTAFTD